MTRELHPYSRMTGAGRRRAQAALRTGVLRLQIPKGWQAAQDATVNGISARSQQLDVKDHPRDAGSGQVTYASSRSERAQSRTFSWACSVVLSRLRHWQFTFTLLTGVAVSTARTYGLAHVLLFTR